MSPPAATCILYTHDPAQSRNVTAFLRDRIQLQPIEDAAALRSRLQYATPTLLLLDLHSDDGMDLLRGLRRDFPDLHVIAMGAPRSEPLLEAEHLGVFAAEAIPLDGGRLRSLVDHACAQVALRIENDNLRDQIARRPNPDLTPSPTPQHAAPRHPAHSLATFSHSLRKFNNVKALTENIVESVASATMITRVGLFCWDRETGRFEFASGLRCREGSGTRTYAKDDPLVHWLEIHACQVARSNLDHVEPHSDRMMLRQELDFLGAEIILPLLGRKHLLGWLFLGNRGTGLPFCYQDLEQLLTIADHVSTTLENALLYEEVAIQKTMAETLLDSLPTGVVSIGTDAQIKSLNEAAEACLGLREEDVLHRTVSTLGSRLADVLLRSLRTDEPVQPTEWTDPRTHKTLIMGARRLMDGDACLGALAMLHDITNQRAIEEKQEQLERSQFWTDLAASMSHEVRNPLVAIKTFAQLLPERFDDSEFRKEFSVLVRDEVDRLNKIIEQINDFANPPQLRVSALAVPQVLESGIVAALKQEMYNGIHVATSFEKDLPPIEGDANALAECFSNLVLNALEATYDRGNPQVECKAYHNPNANGGGSIMIRIKDNGPGIPIEFRDKIFSPFCTSKPRGMGLGLPIAKRTIIDHDGTIDVESSEHGTEVMVSLPARNGGATS